MATLFVSDLHLCRERPDVADAFLAFLAGPASDAEALYVLGDLFEYWAGDDDRHAPFHSSICDALRDVGLRVPLAFIRGNRDLLLGSAFASACAGRLLPDSVALDLYGTTSLIMHGDTLCTDDFAYQRFRRRARNPLVRWLFLALPLARRKAAIEGMRRKSESVKSMTPAAIMDVNAEAVVAAMRRAHASLLIHGHTHRPARHAVNVDGRGCERWVLPDWDTRPGYLSVDPSGCRMTWLS